MREAAHCLRGRIRRDADCLVRAVPLIAVDAVEAKAVPENRA